ncbi:type I-C CRISPR-associated protein Cas7/Csd2 [Leptospira noguchii]|uniref:PF05107 family n=1 Tax=Leptospira noguchii serovar Autumnalis str. ZUN142 TaxID=1085540 RepID=M6UD55_9LEPT|nr:type I-C CRISPR-associated protein Cas7/Csd2 [Leptospira noguchii]EMI71640.1 PF05107 family [Leptospira noguchii str. Bonito]EMO42490.1 PF05107 family [Leptospira noguchii serovar Autumnalis str. ZUN142]UOG37287.1 type I-C CRISPR-associated protein Cas7/Csd2 [Leptospira noguchii]
MNNPIQNRYEFVYLFDVKDGNPNGDPDAGNQPRVDPETGNGLITDVSLKRKIRNYVTIVKSATPPNDIYIKEKAVLIETHEKAYVAVGAKLETPKKEEKEKRTGGDQVGKAREWMCKNFYDVRTFGAVMALKVNAGVVKGPIQFTFARSIDPVINLEHSITRMAVATKKEAEDQDGDNRTMGRKHTISYGLYRAHGFISAHFANDTGFSEEDLELFWSSLQNMFDHDRSAARGEMNCRGLYVFKHVGDGKDANQAKLGVAPAHKLFNLISVSKKDDSTPARDFSDYSVKIQESDLPAGVELIKKVS